MVWLLAALSFFLSPFAGLAEAKLAETGRSLTGWAAICSDGGIRYIRIDDSGGDAPSGAARSSQAPASDDCTCSSCTCCLAGDAGQVGLHPPVAVVAAFVRFARPLIAFAPEAVLAPAEQYWAASRGPPDLKEEKSMTTMHARNTARTAWFAGDRGCVPCF